MLTDKLKNWEYYYQKLPLYMRNSYGIQDHFKIVFDVLTLVDNVEDEICKLYDIFADDYETIIAKYDTTNYNFQFLDMLASLYGINRYMNIKYDKNNKEIRKKLKLTNTELLLFIKCKIIQHQYDGTFSQAKEYYKKIGLPIYLFTSSNSGQVLLYLSTNANITQNIKDLFYANELTLQSMGIVYQLNEMDLSKIGIWSIKDSSSTDNNTWNKAYWA